MSPAENGSVVVDIGVFGAGLLRAKASLALAYQPLLVGKSVFISFISFMTVAELRYGARRAGWGEARLRQLDERIASAEIVWPGPDFNLRATLTATRVRTSWSLR